MFAFYLFSENMQGIIIFFSKCNAIKSRKVTYCKNNMTYIKTIFHSFKMISSFSRKLIILTERYQKQEVPEFMGEIVKVGKVHIKSLFLCSNMGSEMKNVGGETENTEEMKESLYLHNISVFVIIFSQTI